MSELEVDECFVEDTVYKYHRQYRQVACVAHRSVAHTAHVKSVFPSALQPFHHQHHGNEGDGPHWQIESRPSAPYKSGIEVQGFADALAAEKYPSQDSQYEG